METNEVKRIALADTPVGDGKGGTEITMAFVENYFNMNDTFMLEETRQQFFVVSGPVRKNDHYWELQVRIIDDSYDVELEGNPQAGDTARWIANAFNLLGTHY